MSNNFKHIIIVKMPDGSNKSYVEDSVEEVNDALHQDFDGPQIYSLFMRQQIEMFAAHKQKITMKGKGNKLQIRPSEEIKTIKSCKSDCWLLRR